MGSRVLLFLAFLCALATFPQTALAAPAHAAMVLSANRIHTETKAPVSAGRRDHVAVGHAVAPRTPLPGSTSEAYTAQVEFRFGSFPGVSRDGDVNALGNQTAIDPPDTYIAVGPSHVAETVNGVLSVSSRGGALLRLTKLSTIFGLSPDHFAADPRVTYDPSADRWFLSIDELNSSYSGTIWLAVSQTSDPTGSWYLNSVVTSTGTELLDQPKVGLGSDKVVVSWDGFACSNVACAPSGQGIAVLEKSDLLAGTTVRSTYFAPDVRQRAEMPAQTLTPGPVVYLTYTNADPSFRQSTGGPTLGVVSINGSPAAGNVTMSEADPAVQPMTAPPNADQAGGQPLEVNDSRITGAVIKDGVMWAVANEACIPPGDSSSRPCVRFFQVAVSNGTRILQDFDAGETGGAFIYPAVAMDAADNLFVTFSESSSATYPNLMATGEAAVDLPGSLRPLMRYATGGQPYVCEPCGTGPQRFGDYSGAVVDPIHPTLVWLAGEYAAAGSASDWGTEIGAFGFAAPPAVTAAKGGDQALWIHGPRGGFASRGGILAGAPAVLTQKDSSGALNHLYIAPGNDHDLYVRSDSLGWQALDYDGAVQCFDSIGAEIDAGGVLTVACKGVDRALWYAQTTLPQAGGLPAMSTGQWSSLGGLLAAGPAVAEGPSGADFFVTGTDQYVYERSLHSGFERHAWECIGHPAATSTSSATYFACDGLDGRLWAATRGGAGWGGATSLGGRLLDGPGIAARGSSVTYFVEGSDRAVWVRTPTTGFFGLGGVVVGGVAAAG